LILFNFDLIPLLYFHFGIVNTFEFVGVGKNLIFYPSAPSWEFFERYP